MHLELDAQARYTLGMRILWRWFCVASAAAVIGCSAQLLPTDGAVGISDALEPSQQEAALNAVSAWNATHATRLTARVGNMSRGFDGWIQGAAKHYSGPGAVADTAKNWGEEPTTVVDFGAVPAVWWQDAIAHELGHQLGLPHLATGLMRATVDWATETPLNCVDGAAVAKLCEGAECPEGAKGTCQ